MALREARKAVSDEIAECENHFSDSIRGMKSVFSLKYLLVIVIRKLRNSLSGMPFAKF